MPRKAAKLLDSMRRSVDNWTRRDLDTLYRGFGFKIRIGRGHDIAKHPDFPGLRATLPKKHSYLAKGYVTFAIKLIDRLHRLQGEVDDVV